MSTRETIGIVLALVMGALTVAQVSPAAGEPEIFIERTKLIPPTLTATVGERVTFVNRSGRTVHVEFLGDAGRHRVFQIPTEIWAIFHRPGSHPYEVHFPGPKAVTLRGTVEAVEDPSGRPDPHTCDSFTVMGECIER
jgi:plastocyanin